MQPLNLALIILACLAIIGIFIVPDFGESVDEWPNSYYGELFLSLYDRGKFLRDPQIDYYHGPFYMMLFTVTSRFFTKIIPDWLLVDGRHYTNFITFLCGGYFLFTIGLRFLPRRAAWLSFFLYLSHPLLFGHAFINQKDTPLMSFFLFSIAVGYWALDHWTANEVERPSGGSLRISLERDWNGRSVLFRILALVVLVFLLILLVDLWAEGFLYTIPTNIISNAYSEQAVPWIQRAFNRFAEDAYKTPLELYLAKFDTAFLWSRFLLSLALVGAMFWLVTQLFKDTYSRRFKRTVQRWSIIFLAGGVLGLTISIRLIGPLAGFMISLIFFVRIRRHAVAPLAIYWVTAGLFMYLTWPVLWGSPILQLLKSVLATNSFTGHAIYYRGELFPSGTIPWHYLPTLFAIQNTIPFLALLFLGMLGKITDYKSNGLDEFTQLLLLWVLIPLALAGFGVIPIYNNTRHLLFIFPGLVLLAGRGVELLFKRYTKGSLIFSISALILLPGLVAIIRLHPYQYIYYNQLVGGLDGAAGRYHLDYWCTSLRQSASYLNEIAPPNSKIAVTSSFTTINTYLREDLHLYRDEAAQSQPDFGVHCNKGQLEMHKFEGLRLIGTVSIVDVPLAIIEQK